MKHCHFLPVGWLALFLLLRTGSWAQAQAPAWQSAIVSSAPTPLSGGAAVVATATDANGDVYLLGNFTVANLQFGSLQFAGDSHAPGNSVLFVVKWSVATNRFVWGLQSGSTSGVTVATGLAVRGGNVYVTGYFSQNAQFGNTSLTVPFTSTSGTPSNVFVAKITDAGTTADFTWAQKIDSPTSLGNLLSRPAIAVEGTNVYVAGNFRDPSTTTAPSGFGGLSLSSQGGYDVFVTKLVDAGPSSSFAWVQGAGGTDADNAFALTVRGADIYVAGYFNGIASFGSTTLTSAGGTDGFVAKLIDAGASGSFVWAKATSGTGDGTSQALARAPNGVYVAGSFTGAAGFGNITLASAGGTDGFVAKLTDAGATGSFAWAQRAGGTGDDNLTALAPFPAGVYAGGSFSGIASFGTTALTSLGGTDAVVTKLTDAGSGSFAWALSAGSTSNDRTNDLVVPAGGNTLYVGGQVVSANSPATFGPVSIVGTNSGASAFMATIVNGTVTATATGVLATSLAISPNPAHGRATLRVPAEAGTATAMLTVLDALGRPVRTQIVLTNARAELDLAGLPAGLYVVRVQAGGSPPATQRLVLE